MVTILDRDNMPDGIFELATASHEVWTDHRGHHVPHCVRCDYILGGKVHNHLPDQETGECPRCKYTTTPTRGDGPAYA